MMFKKVLIAFVGLILLGSCSSSKQLRMAQKMDKSSMIQHMSYLASDELKGRETGTEEEKKAANYIAKEMASLKLVGAGNNKTFMQAFPYESNPQAMGVKDLNNPQIGVNVMGFYSNNAPNTVIVGAHYDHLGMGGAGSRSVDKNQVHNGADDNGSGVVALLQIIKNVHKLSKNNNYLFIAFSGEEEGLYGSKYFVEHPTLNLEKVNFMINMDMVGRMRDNKLIVHGTGTSPIWKELVTEKNPFKLEIIMKPEGIGPSDHTSFYLKNLPVLHMFTGQHSDYHKPSDDADKIDYNGIALVVSYVEHIVNSVPSNEKIEFTKTKAAKAKKRSKYKVTLGVMPDYAYTGTGLRIDGVQLDRPAERAGIQDGDVVIKMGDLVITDIYKYMEALALYSEGDTIKVKVKRGDEVVEVDVTF